MVWNGRGRWVGAPKLKLSELILNNTITVTVLDNLWFAHFFLMATKSTCIRNMKIYIIVCSFHRFGWRVGHRTWNINKLDKGYFRVDFQRACSNKIWEMPTSCDLLWPWNLVNVFMKITFSGCYYHAQRQRIHLNSIPLQKPILKVFVMMSVYRIIVIWLSYTLRWPCVGDMALKFSY